MTQQPSLKREEQGRDKVSLLQSTLWAGEQYPYLPTLGSRVLQRDVIKKLRLIQD